MFGRVINAFQLNFDSAETSSDVGPKKWFLFQQSRLVKQRFFFFNERQTGLQQRNNYVGVAFILQRKTLAQFSVIIKLNTVH